MSSRLERITQGIITKKNKAVMESILKISSASNIHEDIA
jgi:ribosomal protein L30/L7E